MPAVSVLIVSGSLNSVDLTREKSGMSPGLPSAEEEEGKEEEGKERDGPVASFETLQIPPELSSWRLMIRDLLLIGGSRRDSDVEQSLAISKFSSGKKLSSSLSVEEKSGLRRNWSSSEGLLLLVSWKRDSDGLLKKSSTSEPSGKSVV